MAESRQLNWRKRKKEFGISQKNVMAHKRVHGALESLALASQQGKTLEEWIVDVDFVRNLTRAFQTSHENEYKLRVELDEIRKQYAQSEVDRDYWYNRACFSQGVVESYSNSWWGKLGHTLRVCRLF